MSAINYKNHAFSFTVHQSIVDTHRTEQNAIHTSKVLKSSGSFSA